MMMGLYIYRQLRCVPYTLNNQNYKKKKKFFLLSIGLNKKSVPYFVFIFLFCEWETLNGVNFFFVFLYLSTEFFIYKKERANNREERMMMMWWGTVSSLLAHHHNDGRVEGEDIRSIDPTIK